MATITEGCLACRGTGCCPDCGGAGETTRIVYVRCQTCEGDGDVWADDYQSRVLCRACGGVAEVEEERRAPCIACFGQKTCLACGGSA